MHDLRHAAIVSHDSIQQPTNMKALVAGSTDIKKKVKAARAILVSDGLMPSFTQVKVPKC